MKELRAVMFYPEKTITSFNFNLPNSSRILFARLVLREDKYFLQFCYSHYKQIKYWKEYTFVIVKSDVKSFNTSNLNFINSIKVGQTIFNVYYKC